MTDFLVELRCEEIPARMQAGARADLERLFRAEMESAGVPTGEIGVWSTPRRLALIARDLPERTEAVSEETKGPPVGAPDQALEGFLRKAGLSKDQLEVREVKGKDTWFAVIEKPGRAVREVLADAIPAIVRAFPWPKSMRWGAASLSTESLRWVRPLSGIVAILGENLVECEVGGVRAGYATKGHRFHHPGDITIGSVHDYADKLRACHVIVDHEERERLIRDKARAAAKAAGLTLVEDDGLVIENAGLTEWPVPLLGRFDEAFLDVPPEVIQLTARVNQKYFVCEDAQGKLANAFVCTANIEASDHGEAIVAGNRKVLAARLSDARFFWEQDLKTPLADQAKKLERITFHEKLGTVADKVERVAKLARWLCEEGIVKGADPGMAEQAARLCKADLVTEMVGEFPELQGLMGGYYARAEGLPDAVADAIRDHYSAKAAAPLNAVWLTLAIADRLDTLNGFFSIDEKPTGSKDPFALRRAAIDLLFLTGFTDSRFDLASCAREDVVDFIIERWINQYRQNDARPDLLQAVASDRTDGRLRIMGARMKALQAFIGTEDGANLLAGYKRAANILKKEEYESGAVNPSPEPAEQALIEALDAAGPKAEAAVAAEDFAGAMAALATLRGPIDAFFDSVTVNDPDPARRASRLALLDAFRAAVHNVADFSRIEG